MILSKQNSLKNVCLLLLGLYTYNYKIKCNMKERKPSVQGLACAIKSNLMCYLDPLYTSTGCKLKHEKMNYLVNVCVSFQGYEL